MKVKTINENPADNIIFLGFQDNKIPDFKEVRGKDWILFGADNKFPSHLLYLFNKSSNHNSIINSKVTYISGAGVEDNFIVNRTGEKFNKILKKITTDVELFGGCRLQIVWKIGGGIEIYHIPFYQLRVDKNKRGYWYKKDWTTNTSINQARFIPDFNPMKRRGVQIFAYNEYRPGCVDYPLPGYFGALNDIETDVEISKYNLSVIKNGMFSSKMIVFNTGTPSDEKKRQIERDFKRKFAGSENSGNFMLVFNKDPALAPTVQDLSTTDLDKLFDQLNKTTQAEIFSGHQVTSPSLFGIMEPGKLGGRNEMQDSYEIFKNTYVNDKQQNLEGIIEILFPFMGQTPRKIIPVAPLSIALNPADFKDILPIEWVYEELNIDPELYTSTAGVSPAPGVKTPGSGPAPELMINENVKNLTGRQYQQLMRIVRQFENGKLNQSQATTLLKTSLGLTEEDILSLLKINFSKQLTEEEIALTFAEFGEPRENSIIIKSMKFDKYDEFVDLSQADANIIDLVGKDKRITTKILSETLKISVDYINKRIDKMIEDGVLKKEENKIGNDVIVSHTVNRDKITTRPASPLVNVFIKYSYEKRPEAPGPEILETSRPFCKTLISLDRLYTRADIEQISERVGYDVFTRSGGWWGNDYQCRHEWRRNLILKKSENE